MKIIWMIGSFLLLPMMTFSAEVKGKTYVFDVPDTVIIETQLDPEAYIFDWTKVSPGGISTFLLVQSVVVTNSTMLSSVVEDMKIEMEGNIKLQGLELVSTSEEECDYGCFKGTQIRFRIRGESKTTIDQFMFVLWDGENGWGGQLTASNTNDIKIAHGIIKSGKKVANQELEPTSLDAD